ncbi:hypothetical protein COCNU_scaffold007815G000010 [Cocos nucifera]|nr:hypothetical protein [Cocos nucifera]
MLKEPTLDQHLRQDLETPYNFVILELKELLSEQTLFNIGISQVGPKGSLQPGFGTTPAGLKLEASTFEDYKLVHEGMKDEARKKVGEASIRVDATERSAKDAEAALGGPIEENFWLLGIQEAPTIEIKELKAQLVKVEKLKVKLEKNMATLQAAEKKMAKIQGDMEA